MWLLSWGCQIKQHLTCISPPRVHVWIKRIICEPQVVAWKCSVIARGFTLESPTNACWMYLWCYLVYPELCRAYRDLEEPLKASTVFGCFVTKDLHSKETPLSVSKVLTDVLFRAAGELCCFQFTAFNSSRFLCLECRSVAPPAIWTKLLDERTQKTVVLNSSHIRVS